MQLSLLQGGFHRDWTKVEVTRVERPTKKVSSNRQVDIE
jgi:hypothetical protein